MPIRPNLIFHYPETGRFENPYCDEDQKPGISDMIRWKFSYHLLQKPFITDDYRYDVIPPQRSLTDKNTTLWSGWGMLASDVTFYFAGDTGYFEGFTKIRNRLGPINVAMLSIGAYEPRWYNGAYHLDPDEALRAFEDLNARYFAAMHWGTFDQAEELLGDPPKALRSHAAHRKIDPETIWIFAFGESRAVPPRVKDNRIIYTLDMLNTFKQTLGIQ